MGVLLALAWLTCHPAGLKPCATAGVASHVVQPFRAAQPGAVSVAQPLRAAPTAHRPLPTAQIATLVGRTITATELVLEGSQEGTEEVREFVETTPGKSLSMAEVRETIAHLFSLGRYQDIHVEAFAEGTGVRLRYNLVPVHAVERVEFRGDVGLSTGILRSAITERFGATPSATRGYEVAQRLQEVYNERGYLNAAIRPIVETRHDPDRTILAFEINAGPVARIREVTIEGDPGIKREEFLRRV